MPFIKQERRIAIEKGEMPVEELEVGDLCYIYYKFMVERWRLEPRWRTAHAIYEAMIDDFSPVTSDEITAQQLAWQVFFHLHVMPYELEKREENGDI